MHGSGSRRRRLLAAWAWSAALHTLVILGVARTSWVVVEDEPSTPVAVVWIGDLRTSDLTPAPELELVPPPEPGADPPPDPDADPPPDPDADPPPEPDTDPPPEPDTEAPPEPETEPSASAPPADAESVTERAPAPPPAPPAEPDAVEPSRSFIVREADLEDAWREARDQIKQEQNYLTFSLDDVTEAPLPEEPGPEESIFEAAERFEGRGGSSILSPSNARTRVGRALAEFCNALTGGFGIGLGGFNLGSACADPGESAKLFAHLKPAYLRSRPVCTEVETAGAVTADAAPTIKCRLVLEEDMDELVVE